MESHPRGLDGCRYTAVCSKGVYKGKFRRVATCADLDASRGELRSQVVEGWETVGAFSGVVNIRCPFERINCEDIT